MDMVITGITVVADPLIAGPRDRSNHCRRTAAMAGKAEANRTS